MTFHELLKEIKTKELNEIRFDTQEKLEIVVKTERLGELTTVFDRFFGTPVKPAGDFPSGAAKKYAAPYGGIRGDQTLYCLHDGELCYFVMIWPWADKVLATVKIFQDKVVPIAASVDGPIKKLVKKLFS